MKFRKDINLFTIHDGDSEPTGTVDGHVDVTEGDFLINTDTSEIKVFNGTSWVIWNRS